MSGGVGPYNNDISLGKDEQHGGAPKHAPTDQVPPPPGSKKGVLSFRHLNALAVCVVLSASRMVSIEEIGLVVFSLLYMYFISKVAFPALGPSKKRPTFFDPKNKIFRLYMRASEIIGFFLPIAYMIEGIYEGDKEGTKAASPYVFGVASQVFAEGIAFSGRFSTPICVFVPVFYNSRRIFTLVDWLRIEFTKQHEEYGISAGRVYVGRVLALANMAFWCFNLFGFLLPVFLPRAFKMYYSGYKVK